MTHSATHMAHAEPAPTPARKPVQRTRFDRWLYDFDIDNKTAGQLLGVHPMTIGRYRKLFDDPARQVPTANFIRDVERVSGGLVRFEDWHRPCDVVYLTPPADGAAQ